jgi:hypothetical protein
MGGVFVFVCLFGIVEAFQAGRFGSVWVRLNG